MMLDMVRLEASAKLNRQRKVELGQFLTPSSVARYMASLFPTTSLETARLLDAGAGVGSLSAAFLDRWASGGFTFKRVEATAYDIDDTLRRIACQYYAEARSIAESLGDLLHVGIWLHNAGEDMADRDPVAARTLLQRSRDIFSALGQINFVQQSDEILGRLVVRLRE